MIKASIIIPVFNKWELTRNCLKSIADNTDMANAEVLVVDNASSDQTPRGCPFLGQKLFGDHFRFIRNDSNRNFAGASNQGAEAARGEFVVFLNNDTEVQPNWLAPLLADFGQFPDLGATGPLLLYPEQTPYGRLIQHLGVCVSPSMKVGHLYASIPAASSLARKRRFFQIITAACMAMPRQLFLDTGKFDEGFINGFEDVELCARLLQKNLRMTVNPASLVIHYESQTPGRHEHGPANGALLRKKTGHVFKSDWLQHVQDDGLLYIINDWRRYQAEVPPEIEQELAPALETATRESIKELLLRYVFWQTGWEKAAALAANPREKATIMRIYMKLFHDPKLAFRTWRIGQEIKDPLILDESGALLNSYAGAREYYRAGARMDKEDFEENNDAAMLASLKQWQDNPRRFDNLYADFARDYMEFARQSKMLLNPVESNAYNLWLYGSQLAREIPTAFPQTPFSILLPLHNPQAENLSATLRSILDQSHKNWELLLALCKVDGQCQRIIREHAARDKRIKIIAPENNPDPATAANAALKVASSPWLVPLSQNGELARDSLAWIAQGAAASPGAMLFYADEDKLNENGAPSMPYFKNFRLDWDLLAEQNLVGQFFVCQTERLRKIGGWRQNCSSADSYDLLLRYLDGIKAGQIIHVPRILYHERFPMADASGAPDMEVLRNNLKSCQEWLDKAAPGARCRQMPGYVWRKVDYPLPAEPNRVSIVSPFPLSAQITSLAGYPLEMLVSNDANAAAKNARGEYLCFLSHEITDASQHWLAELVSRLSRPDAGAVGAKLTRDNGSLLHGGYLTDASGLPKPLFAGTKDPHWFGWPRLARTVAALDGACLLTRRKDFLALDGLDAEMGNWGFQDYCLRLDHTGKNIIWWPFAELASAAFAALAAPKAFRQKWQGKLAPFNPNLLIAGGGFALADTPV